MKTFALSTIVLMLLFAGTASAQDGASGGVVLGFGVLGAVPMGDFADVSSFGFGGTATFGYLVSPDVMITGRSGYARFSGKDFFDGVAFSFIPVLAGVKAFFTEGEMRVYGAGEGGLFIISSDAAGSESSSEFGVVPTLGAQFKAGDKMNVDVNANLTNIFSEGSSTSWVGFGIGLEFLVN